MNNESKKLTIILPTKNRPECLLRLLRYYVEVGFQGILCIGDSSEGEHLECNKRQIKMFGGIFITHSQDVGNGKYRNQAGVFQHTQSLIADSGNNSAQSLR